jgi:Secretion system C-terminal sorting domain/SprB repeat/SdrD B-like domain
MKKFLTLLSCVAFAVTCSAQTVSFSLATQPCHNDGTLIANFSGLQPPLTVSWQTAGTTAATIIHTDVTGLVDALTSYSGSQITITATDDTGATVTGFYSGSAPFTICPLSVLVHPCPSVDTVYASVCSGGTAPFTFQWYDEATSAIVGMGDTLAVPAGHVYGVTVTDALGCTYGSLVDPINIYAYVIATFSGVVSTTTANCNNGTASVVPSGGGTAPFTYLWSNGANTSTISGLNAGTYHVIVQDATGCTDSEYAVVPQSVTITGPVTATATSCSSNDGMLVSSGTGGVAPYSYVWSNGATGATVSGLSTGFYTVNITDANGCTGSDVGFVSSTAPITYTYSVTPSSCVSANGTATLHISGGTSPYVVSWFTDPSQTGMTATSLETGTYGFHIKDAAGCGLDGSLYIQPIDIISVSFLSTPASCTRADGAITAYPIGGSAPYSYSWSTGATTAGISGRMAGSYPVTITDRAGCKTTVNAVLPSNTPIGVGFTSLPASCIFNNDGIDTGVAWGGTAPYAYGWSSGGTTAVINNLLTGPYWLTVSDGTGCVSQNNYSYVDYNTADDDCYCIVTGTVYADTNNNCVRDPGELGIPNVQIHIAGSTPDAGYTYTDANGNYSYKVRSGTYTVSESVLPYYPLSSCQTNGTVVNVTAGGSCSHEVDFANTMDSVHDTHISTWDYTMPVAGNTYMQAIVVTNNGTLPEDSILATHRTDLHLFEPMFQPSGNYSGASGYYTTATNNIALAAGMATSYFVDYAVPANMPVGTSLSFNDSVVYHTPIPFVALEYNPNDNYSSLATTSAAASYATNFKEVNPQGTGAIGSIPYTDSVLEYMIHYQNTERYQVQNMTIIDTLDNDLDWTTLRPEYASAPCYVTLMQVGAHNVVKFTFTDVNLPPAEYDAVRSNGMLTYTVHIKPGLAAGTQFTDRASVYFDDHAPVLTNAPLNTLSSSGGGTSHVGVPAVASLPNTFTVYPNPAGNTFNAAINAANAGDAVLCVSDITGRTVFTTTVAIQKGTQTTAVDVSSLASGTYFVTCLMDGATQTRKLVIIK